MDTLISLIFQNNFLLFYAPPMWYFLRAFLGDECNIHVAPTQHPLKGEC